jgi:REP element-mobilizing transposase RayT
MTAFVTFRLSDSLPYHVLQAYAEERRNVERQLKITPNDPELRKLAVRLFAHHIDRCLDRGLGKAFLRGDAAAQTLASLRFFDGERYTLHAATVMPNHVHVVLTLHPDWGLKKITHGWKSYLGHKLAAFPNAPKPIWQDESYDHIVRDSDEFLHLVRYTLRNPEVAGLKNWPWIYPVAQASRLREWEPESPPAEE